MNTSGDIRPHVLFVFGSQTCVPSDPLATARRLGFSVTVLAEHQPCGLAPEWVAQIVLGKLRDQAAVIRLARQIHSHKRISATVGYDDQAVPLVARIAAELSLPGNPPDAADAARDKPLMKERFRVAGVPIAAYHLCSGEDDALSSADGLGYPVVVKPVRGSASQGVIRADSPDDLRTAYRRGCRIVSEYGLDTGDRPGAVQLVEEYIHGPEYSVELLVSRGRAFPLCVFEKPKPLNGPFFEETIYLTPPRLHSTRIRELEALAIRAREAVGLRVGLAHCEIRIGDRGAFVLELAARLIGGACSRVFRTLLPLDIHELILRLSAGEDVPPPPVAHRAAGALMLPIPANGRLVTVRGVDAARSVPGIRDVIVNATPGDVIVQFPEQSCYIGFFTADGETPEDVESALSEASECLEVELAPLECERWVRSIDVGPSAPLPDGIQTLAGLTAEQARARVVPVIADAHFADLPTDEAQREAASCVNWLEAGHRGETAPAVWLLHGTRGVALPSWDGMTGYVSCLGVSPGARRQGIATKLLQAVMTLLARRGCTEMEVLVDPRSPTTTALYRRLGFASAAGQQTCCCKG